MKKTTRIILALISILAVGMAFAGTDTLVALGVPEIIAQAFAVSGGVSSAILLPIGEQQTGLVIAYQNKDLIADKVMPIVQLPGNKLSFKWWEKSTGTAFTVPDDRVGRTSAPREIFFDGEERTGTCIARGFSHTTPIEDIMQMDDKNRFTNGILQGLINKTLLAREVRVAGIVQDTNNYLASQVTNVQAGDRIGAPTADVFNMISSALDSALVRPNKIGMGSKVYSKLRVDPSIVQALYPNSNGKGVVTKEQLAELFEVDEIIVGKSRVNQTKNAKNPTLVPCWGNNLWGIYQETLSTMEDGITWGLTAQAGERYAEVVEDKMCGLKGGEMIKAGVYHAEVVMAKGAGVFFKDICD